MTHMTQHRNASIMTQMPHQDSGSPQSPDEKLCRDMGHSAARGREADTTGQGGIGSAAHALGKGDSKGTNGTSADTVEKRAVKGQARSTQRLRNGSNGLQNIWQETRHEPAKPATTMEREGATMVHESARRFAILPELEPRGTGHKPDKPDTKGPMGTFMVHGEYDEN